MTIWGTYVFAKPLGRCAQTLRALQPPENIPAMNNLLQTLDEYLQATDVEARDVYRKAMGQLSQDADAHATAAAPLGDEEVRAIANAICDEKMVAEHGPELVKFARAIEAQLRMQSTAKGT